MNVRIGKNSEGHVGDLAGAVQRQILYITFFRCIGSSSNTSCRNWARIQEGWAGGMSLRSSQIRIDFGQNWMTGPKQCFTFVTEVVPGVWGRVEGLQGCTSTWLTNHVYNITSSQRPNPLFLSSICCSANSFFVNPRASDSSDTRF